jgi:hypothetical protein
VGQTTTIGFDFAGQRARSVHQISRTQGARLNVGSTFDLHTLFETVWTRLVAPKKIFSSSASPA